MSKAPSTATNLRKRRAALNTIRKQITIQYHALSHVAMDDMISSRPKPGAGEIVVLPEGMTPNQVIVKPDELTAGVRLLSDAINCLNRELGRRENSNALGDGTS